MRIAVISDTHLPRGTRRLPEACVARLQSADLILHGGDLVSVGFLDWLRALGPPVEAVVGNVDEPALHDLLPSERIVEVSGRRIGMVHIPGPEAGRADRLLARFPDCAAIVFGHTHQPVVERARGVWLLNPGSPTERRQAPVRTMLELELDGRGIAPRLVDLPVERGT